VPVTVDELVAASLAEREPELRELVRRAVDEALGRIVGEVVAAELELRRNGGGSLDAPPPEPEEEGPREDRDPEARLFADSGADALRTSIAKACRAAAIPLFSPHDLRHRRICLLHLRGVPWARIGEFVGQRSLSVTADTYTHVLPDEHELDYAALLSLP